MTDNDTDAADSSTTEPPGAQAEPAAAPSATGPRSAGSDAAGTPEVADTGEPIPALPDDEAGTVPADADPVTGAVGTPDGDDDTGAAPEPGPAPTRAERRARAAAARVDAIRAQGVDVHPPTALERVSYAAVRGLFFGVAKLYFRLEVRGTANVPPHGPFVLAPVHRSNLDFILVSTVRRPRMRYMGKASIWKSKALGRFVSMLGAFPVHRGTADRESLRTCMRVIENGEPLVMFPEGTRRSGDAVEDLFDGPAYVASRAGVPLVPVGIGGSDDAMPVGARLIRPRKIVLIVGGPIVPPTGDGSGRVPRRVVRQLTDELQVEVQRLYDEARAAAG
jgi:1-acyl-sn-glycerol-3-phosphate acyltransferase